MLWEKWQHQILVIRHDLLKLEGMRLIKKEVKKIQESNPIINKPNIFYTFIFNGYRNTLIMGIKRQIKVKKGSISLLGLLVDINKNKEVIERVIKPNNYYKINQIENDINYIKEQTKIIARIADKYLSHIDEEIVEETITIDTSEIEKVLKDLVDKTEYYLVVLGKGDLRMIPNIEGRWTWRKIFETPWIVKNNKCSTP